MDIKHKNKRIFPVTKCDNNFLNKFSIDFNYIIILVKREIYAIVLDILKHMYTIDKESKQNDVVKYIMLKCSFVWLCKLIFIV